MIIHTTMSCCDDQIALQVRNERGGFAMLIRCLLSSVLCAMPLGAADAADLLRPYGPPPLVPVFSWTGFYVGIHAGGEFGDTSFSDPFSGFSNNPRIAGFEGGGQVGFDYQMGAVVIGAEADISGTTLIGNATDAAMFTRRTNGQWLSTVTGRLGYAVDRWLLYGKGGVAIVSLSDSLTDPNLNVEFDRLSKPNRLDGRRWS